MLKLGDDLVSRACLHRIAEVHGGNSGSWRCFIGRHSGIVDSNITGMLSTAISSSIQITLISILDMSMVTECALLCPVQRPTHASPRHLTSRRALPNSAMLELADDSLRCSTPSAAHTTKCHGGMLQISVYSQLDWLLIYHCLQLVIAPVAKS